ncbi:superoxide dismutase [Candidatus Dojkabacteria bacterium]|nr:superoxide dismutase [Candidatus Dojkabacteria bacterium]
MGVMKKYKLPDLIYSYNSLEPVISEEIMQLHHRKHHAGYVKKANKALEVLDAGDYSNIKHVLRDLSFNLNGHKLHSVFWKSMRAPDESNSSSPKVKKKIEEKFKSFKRFKELFANTAKSVEGSGWAVLLGNERNDNFEIMQIENHNKLYLTNYKLLLALDVWEHAYYLDYKNDRNEYVDRWWNVVNWDEVEQKLI